MPSKGAVVDSGKPAQPSGASQSTPVHPDEILYNSPLKGRVLYIPCYFEHITETDLLGS